jgi:precorrin-6B methylase 2
MSKCSYADIDSSVGCGSAVISIDGSITSPSVSVYYIACTDGGTAFINSA